jgi:hypothetical protein
MTASPGAEEMTSPIAVIAKRIRRIKLTRICRNQFPITNRRQKKKTGTRRKPINENREGKRRSRTIRARSQIPLR